MGVPVSWRCRSIMCWWVKRGNVMDPALLLVWGDGRVALTDS
jgi:hypothetical protein